MQQSFQQKTMDIDQCYNAGLWTYPILEIIGATTCYTTTLECYDISHVLPLFLCSIFSLLLFLIFLVSVFTFSNVEPKETTKITSFVAFIIHEYLL
jgi:hypothetical protein